MTGLEPGPPGKKSNALTTEPKSGLPDAVCQKLYLYDTLYRIAVLLIEAMHHVICQTEHGRIISSECVVQWDITRPRFLDLQNFVVKSKGFEQQMSFN